MTDLMPVTALRPVAAVPVLRTASFPGKAPFRTDPLQVTLPELTELLGGMPDTAPAANACFAMQRVARGANLIHEGAAADWLYVVQSGSFKCIKTAEDGYEHVLGFAWQRDLLGYDGLALARYAFAAVALQDSRVIALPTAGLSQLRRRSPELDALLQSCIARQLAHVGEIAEVMAAVAADARLARFLVQLSVRMAEHGHSPRRLLLRMSRRDIANHLRLAQETISRSFRVLAENGWLTVDATAPAPIAGSRSRSSACRHNPRRVAAQLAKRCTRRPGIALGSDRPLRAAVTC